MVQDSKIGFHYKGNIKTDIRVGTVRSVGNKKNIFTKAKEAIGLPSNKLLAEKVELISDIVKFSKGSGITLSHQTMKIASTMIRLFILDAPRFLSTKMIGISISLWPRFHAL